MAMTPYGHPTTFVDGPRISDAEPRIVRRWLLDTIEPAVLPLLNDPQVFAMAERVMRGDMRVVEDYDYPKCTAADKVLAHGGETLRALTMVFPRPQTRHVPSAYLHSVIKAASCWANDANICELWFASATKRTNATRSGSSTA